MSATAPSSLDTRHRRPRYVVPCLALSIVSVGLSLPCFVPAMIGEDVRFPWARLFAAVLSAIGLIGIATTLLCQKMDSAISYADTRLTRVDRRLDEIAELLHSTLTQQQALTRLAGDALDVAKDNGVVISRAERRASESAEGWLAALGRYDAMRVQLEALEQQQQTLAEMVCHPDRLVLDVPNNDIYELGRRVGQEEAERRRGEDQTP